jgi:hypothetical protein
MIDPSNYILILTKTSLQILSLLLKNIRPEVNYRNTREVWLGLSEALAPYPGT